MSYKHCQRKHCSKELKVPNRVYFLLPKLYFLWILTHALNETKGFVKTTLGVKLWVKWTIRGQHYHHSKYFHKKGLKIAKLVQNFHILLKYLHSPVEECKVNPSFNISFLNCDVSTSYLIVFKYFLITKSLYYCLRRHPRDPTHKDHPNHDPNLEDIKVKGGISQNLPPIAWWSQHLWPYYFLWCTANKNVYKFWSLWKDELFALQASICDIAFPRPLQFHEYRYT